MVTWKWVWAVIVTARNLIWFVIGPWTQTTNKEKYFEIFINQKLFLIHFLFLVYSILKRNCLKYFYTWKLLKQWEKIDFFFQPKSWGALGIIDFHFLPNWVECDRGENFPFDFVQMEFHLVQDRKANYYHDHI